METEEIDSTILSGIQNHIRNEVKDEIRRQHLAANLYLRLIPVSFAYDWIRGEVVPPAELEKVVPHAIWVTLVADADQNLIFFEAETWIHLEEILQEAPLTLHQRSALMGVYSLNGTEIESLPSALKI